MSVCLNLRCTIAQFVVTGFIELCSQIDIRTHSFHTYKTLQTRYAQRPQTSADPEDPDFGLWTRGCEAWSGSPPKLYHLVLEPCPTPPKNFVQNPFTSLRVIRRTDRQTDRQTDRTKNITSFFGGGNKIADFASVRNTLLAWSTRRNAHQCPQQQPPDSQRRDRPGRRAPTSLPADPANQWAAAARTWPANTGVGELYNVVPVRPPTGLMVWKRDVIHKTGST